MEKIENSTLDGLDLTFAGARAVCRRPPPRRSSRASTKSRPAIKAADERLRADGPGAAAPAGDGPAEGARPPRRIADAGPRATRPSTRSTSGWRRQIEKFEGGARPRARPPVRSARRRRRGDAGTAGQGDADRGEPRTRRRRRSTRSRSRASTARAPTCQTGPVQSGAHRRAARRLSRIPANARTTEPYWTREGEAGRYVFDDDAPFGLPFRPTPFHARSS